MKTRLAVTLSLTALCLLLVTSNTGIGHAQPPQLTPQAYLPVIIAPCVREASAYMTASDPLIHVSDTLTVTGAIVNECAKLVGKPSLVVKVQSTGVLTPLAVGDPTYASVGIGQYLTFTVALQAIGPGEETIDGFVTFENMNDNNPPMEYWDVAIAQPITIRVVPNSVQTKEILSP
jgi:hypothetical protein